MSFSDLATCPKASSISGEDKMRCYTLLIQDTFKRFHNTFSTAMVRSIITAVDLYDQIC